MGELEKKRYIEYDIMRIVACLGVIMIHAAVFGQEDLYDYTTWEYQWIKIWGVLARWAVPAFIMLSGMMILPKADTVSISRLLKHRVIRMIAAYIAWSCIYSAYNVYVLNIVYAPTKFKTFIDGCFSGEIHMWYLLMLAGLYLASPILGVLVKRLNQKWTLYWLVCMFIFTSLIPLGIKMEIPFISTIIASFNNYMDAQFFGGMTLYFVLGYFIGQHQFSNREKIVIYVLAASSLIFTFEGTILYCLRNGVAYGILSYEYPNIVFFSIGIMVFFKEEISKISFSARIQRIIYEISKLTFGIYMIHILMLKIFFIIGINIKVLYPAVAVPLIAILVFIVGGMITWTIRRVPVIGKYIA